MTEQQKKAVEEVVKKFKLFPSPTGFILGIIEVIENPEMYGLQQINERQEE